MTELVIQGFLEGLTPPQRSLFVAATVLFAGLVLGIVAAWVVRRLLVALDVDEVVEGTPFERTARQLGSSTVKLLAWLSGLFVFVVAATVAARTLELLPSEVLLDPLTRFLPRLFVAVVVVIVGLLVADKAELFVGERLRSIKLPEVTLIPTLVRFSVLYVAALIALSQLGVATAALLVLLAAYAFGVFFLAGLAFRDLMSSSIAGVYLLLTEPYSIGDEVVVDGNRGIVQEVDVFVTRIENDGEEYIVPNRKILREGAIRIRE